jgi:hypothetical protein
MRASSRSVSNFIASSSSCKIVLVEECAGEVGATVALLLVTEEERERVDIVGGLSGCR